MTTLVLTLAANTSFGGLPVLLSLLARDNVLPHAFGLRSERPVYGYGVAFLGLSGAALLVAAGGSTQRLVPLFAIGVFVGFTLSQLGLARRARRLRGPRWRLAVAADLAGGALSAVAAVVFLATKLLAGAWLLLIVVPALMVLFAKVDRYYRRVGQALGLGRVPPWPEAQPGVVIVPVGGIRPARRARAVRGAGDGQQRHRGERADLRRQRRRPAPPVGGLGLRHRAGGPAQRPSAGRARGRVRPAAGRQQPAGGDGARPAVEPRRRRYQLLQNQRGRLVATTLRRQTDVVVATLPFRIGS